MKPTTITIFIALLWLQFNAFTQTIDASRRVDWSIVGVEGGITCVSDDPSIFDIMDYGGVNDGSADNTTAIQNAFSAASGAGVPTAVIYFPPGDYLINSSIRVPQNTIIRGAAHDSTYFIFDLGGAANPCFDTPIWDWGSYVNVTAGVSKGSTVVTVADGSQFTVGQWIEIEEDNNATLMYTDPQWDQSWAQYAKGQFARVTNISGNDITIDRPIKASFDLGQTVRARRGRLAENIGFECFHITRTDLGDSYTFLVKNSANVWFKNVYSFMTNKAHIWTERAVNVEIRESYFERAYDYGGGGHGYGISIGYHSGDILAENNIFKHLRHALIIAKGAYGCVFGYNYSLLPVQGPDGDTTTLNSGWDPPDISIHGHWSYMNLYEGNIVVEAHSADFWGPSGPGTTLFRNRVTSNEGIKLDDGSVDQNAVGNELMTGTVWEDASVSNSFIHGNNEMGTVQWDGSKPNSLIDSYYLTGKPSWWGATAWPAIGPEFTLGSGEIPAKIRYDAGEKIPDGGCPCGVVLGLKDPVKGQLKDETHKFSVSPNPSSGRFYIHTSEEDYIATLFDLNGHEVMQLQGSTDLQFGEELPRGFYLLKIRTETGLGSYKLIKK